MQVKEDIHLMTLINTGVAKKKRKIPLFIHSISFSGLTMHSLQIRGVLFISYVICYANTNHSKQNSNTNTSSVKSARPSIHIVYFSATEMHLHFVSMDSAIVNDKYV